MNLRQALSSAINEKDVENAYRAYISKIYKNGIFTSPYNCDGLFVNNDLRMLCEFKYNCNLKNNKDALIIIAQSIYYIKKFIKDGENIPNVIFIGDKDECFIIPVSMLMGYLNKDYDWSIPASSAWDENNQIKIDLLNDSNINFMLFDINTDFKWETIHTYLTRCIKQIKADIAINSETIIKAYEYWIQNVINDVTITDGDNIEIFFKVLMTPQDIYLHPKKDGIMVIGNREIKIKKRGFHGFFTCYKENHNPMELKELTANKDRLMVEGHRRRTGAFFTPSLWVDEAHKMLTESLGEGWRDEYIVWDCSAGSANLTRDYSFKELYLSTLEENDINLIKEAGYNKRACIFQFDFLNDSLDKLPASLMNALESGKKIVFLNNPPYGTAKNGGQDNISKAGIAINNIIYNDMENNNIGGSSQNLYAQFMYRIMKIIKNYNLKDSIMATYSKSKFMTSKQFSGFRTYLNNTFTFMDGMVFKANHFSDVSDSWGIAFTIFKH